MQKKLDSHIKELSGCSQCPKMIGPVVYGESVLSKVMLVGQAPGVKEGSFGKPFAWTAGKTMFKWFSSIGIEEEDFRNRVYMAAVCRCFPGKNPKGGDRVPDKEEIENCASWMKREFEITKPELVIPVGKLAISQFIEVKKLTEVIGEKLKLERFGHEFEMISLPHPSGASTWHRMEPGKTLLQKSLQMIKKHKSFKNIL